MKDLKKSWALIKQVLVCRLGKTGYIKFSFYTEKKCLPSNAERRKCHHRIVLIVSGGKVLCSRCAMSNCRVRYAFANTSFL